MAAVSVTPADLAPFAEIEPIKAAAMIEDAMALAARVAPCITEPDFAYPEAAKAIIRGAILRWNEAGSGTRTQETIGPFSQSVDMSQNRRGRFWATEISDLSKLCANSTGSAFVIETAPRLGGAHVDICSIYFGASYCSCGASIAGFPLWETQ